MQKKVAGANYATIKRQLQTKRDIHWT